jgi:hypothetical protein
LSLVNQGMLMKATWDFGLRDYLGKRWPRGEHSTLIDAKGISLHAPVKSQLALAAAWCSIPSLVLARFWP